MDEEISKDKSSKSKKEKIVLEERWIIEYSFRDDVCDWRTGKRINDFKIKYRYYKTSPILLRYQNSKFIEIEYGYLEEYYDDFDVSLSLSQVAKKLDRSFYKPEFDERTSQGRFAVEHKSTQEKEILSLIINKERGGANLVTKLLSAPYETLEDCKNHLWETDIDAYYQLVNFEFDFISKNPNRYFRVNHINNMIDPLLAQFVTYDSDYDRQVNKEGVNRSEIYDDEKLEMLDLSDLYNQEEYSDSNQIDLKNKGLITINFVSNTPTTIIFDGKNTYKLKLTRDVFAALAKFIDIRQIKQFICKNAKIDDIIDPNTFQSMKNNLEKVNFIQCQLPKFPKKLFYGLKLTDLTY